MNRKSVCNIRPIWLKDYCINNLDVRPFYWFEESAELYGKANMLINKLKKMDRVTNSPELSALIDIDIDLIELWQGFEQEAMAGIGKISEGKLSPIKLPTIFGYPETVYYHNGILIFHTSQNDVKFLLN